MSVDYDVICLHFQNNEAKTFVEWTIEQNSKIQTKHD